VTTLERRGDLANYGKIVEDWTVSDSLGLLRQLGPWRVALLAAGQLRSALRA
jgi:hypothetical protein